MHTNNNYSSHNRLDCMFSFSDDLLITEEHISIETESQQSNGLTYLSPFTNN